MDLEIFWYSLKSVLKDEIILHQIKLFVFLKNQISTHIEISKILKISYKSFIVRTPLFNHFNEILKE